MSKILGLTINYNCVSWALLTSTKQSPKLQLGLRVFQPSVTNLGTGSQEESRLVLRTKYRNARKSTTRRQYRKMLVLKTLIENDMCPCSVSAWLNWRNHGLFPSKALKVWLDLNPYDLRVKGISTKLTLLEIGRVFYHIAQRRGKQISLWRDSKYESSVFMNGDPKTNRLGLHAIQQAKAKHLTIGQHLASFQHEKNKPFKKMDQRIRNRYLSRELFVQEFHQIFDQQKKYHGELTEHLREKLGGIRPPDNDGKSGLLFFQRERKYGDYYRPVCPYEPQKKGTPKSNPLYEYFRILKWISQIQYNGQFLHAKQREKVRAVALRFTQFSFKKVRKALDLEDQSIRFNVDENEKIYLSHTLVNLGKPQLFGPSFFLKPIEDQMEIWHTILFFDDEKKLQEHAMREWQFSEEQSKMVCQLRLAKGYAPISAKAIRSLIYFLQMGLTFQQAVFLSAVKRGADHKWSSLSKTEELDFIHKLLKKYNNKKQSLKAAEIKEFLDQQLGISNFNQKKYDQYLYADSSDQSYGFQMNHISDRFILSHFKPILQKPIFELRKIVHSLLKEHGEVDTIKAFVRPELKASRSGRKRQFLTKRKRNSTHDYHRRKVVEMGQNPTHINVYKHRLWEEASGCCPYTGETINIHQLFSDKVSIVYILPWQRFFNDSDQNKTICLTSFKPKIMTLTPWEFFTSQGPGVWEKVKTRVLTQFTGSNGQKNLSKFKQFTMSNFANEAISNEFNDCHHVSLSIKELLQEVCPNVQMTLGHATHSLRKNWYLDSLDDFLENDPLLDYRRHGVDALITAVKTPEILNELTKWNRYERIRIKKFPSPWKSFKHDVEREFYSMPISFQRPKNCFTMAVSKNMINKALYEQRSHSARGQLHKELFYGRRKSPQQVSHGFHIRKSIQKIQTAKHVKKIVDPVIRQRIYDLIDKSGGFDNGQVPKNALISVDEQGQIHTKLTLPNTRGEDVPVHKVRICESIHHAIQVDKKMNKYVNSRNNHHVLIYKDLEGLLQEDVVQFWTAVNRMRKKEPLVQLPPDGQQVVTTLQINDFFLMGLTDQEYFDFDKLPKRKCMKHLYRVQRISTKFYEFKQVYDADIYNTSFPNYIRILNFGQRKTGWLTYNPKKVLNDNLGNIKKIKEKWTDKQPQKQS